MKHIHKFRRHKYKTGSVTYFCATPDCSVKLNPSLALGKSCICWRCEQPFVMNEYAIRLAKPHCERCHKPKNSELETESSRESTFEGIVSGSDMVSDLQTRLDMTNSNFEDEDI